MRPKLIPGVRVHIPTFGLSGIIDFVSYEDLGFPFRYPVQVKLDTPYDWTGHKMLRFDPKELEEENEAHLGNELNNDMEEPKPRNDKRRRGGIQSVRGGSFPESVRYSTGVIITSLSPGNPRTIGIYGKEGQASFQVVFGPKRTEEVDH